MNLQSGTLASKSAAILLSLIGFAFVWLAVVNPIIAGYERAGREVRMLNTTLLRHTTVAGQRGSLARELAKLQSDGRLKTLMLKPASDGRAAAELQKRMENLIESSGARLSSILALPVQPSTGVRKIGLRLQFSAANSSLRKVLHALEYGRPLSVLDNVFIHSASAKSVGNRLPITVRLDVFMFLPGKS